MHKEVNGRVFDIGGKVAFRREISSSSAFREIFREEPVPRPSGGRIIPRRGWKIFLFRSRSRVVPKRRTSGAPSRHDELDFGKLSNDRCANFPPQLPSTTTTTAARNHPRPFGPLSVISAVLFKDLRKISGGRVYLYFKDFTIFLFL